MQSSDKLISIQSPLLIKNIKLRNDNSVHIHITENYELVTITNEELQELEKKFPVLDAHHHISMLPGMLDSHVHGQGGSDFGTVKNIADVKVAALALGETGLSYALATVSSLDPDWCELRVIDCLPTYTKGATTERGNVEQALFQQLPGRAKTAYLIIKNKLYYADKIEENIIEIANISQASINELMKLASKKNTINEVLSLEHLALIKKLTRHERSERGLPTVLKTIQSYMQEQEKNPIAGATKILGVHLEGPFIAHNCKGAHDERMLQDSIDYAAFLSIISFAPNIKNWKMTLAPDLPGAVTFMQTLKKNTEHLATLGISIKINVGHTNASKDLITQCMELDAAGITHCGNACKEPNCRNQAVTEKDVTSNVVQWVLENPAKCPKGIELIVDGHHLSEQFVKLMVNTIGHKINLVTDALGPTGLENGKYLLGLLPIYKKDSIFYLADPAHEGEAYITQPPILAGSATSLYDCAERFSRWACGNEEKQGKERLEAIYYSSIHNPRTSSLSPVTITELESDNKNAVFLTNDGKLVFSLCQGKVFIDKKEWEKFSLHTPNKAPFVCQR